MTELVPIRRGKSTQVSLLDIQERLDARKQLAETRTSTSTRKSRVEGAKSRFEANAKITLEEIQESARELAEVFDASINTDSLPLSQVSINRLSSEFLALERLKIQIEALEGRYRSLIFGHLDEVGPRVPGRPATHVPGKVEAEGPGPYYVFERRGGNREHPDLDAQGLREELSPDLVAQIYVTVHHDAVEAYDELVFDEGRFGELIEDGKIDLDVVEKHLTPGKRRTPSFHKTLMSGE